MIRIIRQEVRLRLAEHGRPTPISLRKDDLIEQHDTRVGRRPRFAFMDEFIEGYHT